MIENQKMVRLNHLGIGFARTKQAQANQIATAQ